jgi:hypothetical protein
MTDIKPRFFESENKVLAHLEWEAIRMICFGGSHMGIDDAYPKFERSRTHWTQYYYDNAKDEHHSLKRKINKREYQSLDEFYEALKPVLKPKPRGKMLKDKKKRTSQKEYQRDSKGEAFIDNDPLFSAAAKCTFDFAEAFADEHAIALKAEELAGQFDNGTPLNELQMSVLRDYIQQRIDPDKNVYYMWGQIKRRCLKDDTITWPQATAAKLCRCSKTEVSKIMNKLIKLGAITRVQEGKRGANSGRAAIYRREI